MYLAVQKNKMYQNQSFDTHDIHQKLYDILFESISLDQTILDEQGIEPVLRKRPHDDQDRPNDCKGQKIKKRRKDAGQPSYRSSKKDKAPMEYIQEDIHFDQP
ncbi:hypothetical protein Tco_0115917 [Tanacetum coccineum]